MLKSKVAPMKTTMLHIVQSHIRQIFIVPSIFLMLHLLTKTHKSEPIIVPKVPSLPTMTLCSSLIID